MRFNWFFLVLFGLVSCSETDISNNTDRLGYHYFPLEVGNYRIYDVKEIKYTVLNVETSFYELKESIVDSFLNTSNNLQFVVHRSTRANSSESWVLDSIWTARRTADVAILTENNIAHAKLSFPIEQGKVWDGNSYNSKSAEFYVYELLAQDTTLADTVFEGVVRVIQNDKGEDPLGIQNHSELYAPNVGLIAKESISINYCQTDCESEKDIQSGREYVMSIKAYGKE